MVQVRRQTTTPRKRGAKRKPGWLLLLLGLAVGIAGVLVIQLIIKRADSRDGLAGLFVAAGRPAGKPAAATEPAPAKTAKTRFDFYTILPETETLLPERNRSERVAKAKPEEGVSYVLQAGSFNNFQDADQLKAKLAMNGLVAQIQKIIIEGKGEYYRVRLGPYENLEALDATERLLKQLGIAKPLAIKVKKGAG